MLSLEYVVFERQEGTFQRWPLLLVGQHGALQEYPCPGDRSVFRDKVQGGRMCPWDLMFVLLDFRAFLYRDDLGLRVPLCPQKFRWNRAPHAVSFAGLSAVR